MATVIKDRITSDLKKAKDEGGLRAERIREIVKSAVAQAFEEVKEGSVEIRTVVRDAIAAVVELAKDRGQEAKAEVAASVEGVIEGIRASREKEIANTQAQVDQLQSQIDVQAQQLEADVDSALVAIETEAKQSSSSEFRSLLENLVGTIRESKQFLAVKEQYARLRSQLVKLDESLAERYGDRYDYVKQQLEKYWESATVWYEKNKAEVATGKPDPVQKAHINLGVKMAEAGAVVAKKEREIKERIKDMLH